MPDKKPTDSDIVKALECCVGEQYPCSQCPYQEIKHYDYDNNMFEIMPNGIQYDQWSCDRWLLIDLLDLINRLQEENERSKPFQDKFSEFNSHIRVEDMLVCASSLGEWLEFCENLKTEAYKEFAERLKENFIATFSFKGVVMVEEIDDLLKEMVGDSQ